MSASAPRQQRSVRWLTLAVVLATLILASVTSDLLVKSNPPNVGRPVVERALTAGNQTNPSDRSSALMDGGSGVAIQRITLPGNPAVVVHDDLIASGQGQVFLDDYPSGCPGSACASNLTVISESNYSIVASIPLPSLAELAYDSETGVVAVSCQSENLVISAHNDTVLATLSDEAIGGIIGYLSQGNFWLTANESTLSFVNASTDAIAGSVTLAANPGAWTIDSATDELFVVDGTTDADVAVVSLDNFTQVASIDAGYEPLGLTYVSGQGKVFVQDTNENVTVVSDSSNSPIAVVPVGYLPRYAAFDSSLGEIFVGSVGSESEGAGSTTTLVGDNITVINVTSDAVSGFIPVASEGLAVSEAWGTVFSVDLLGFTAVNATTGQVQSTLLSNETLILPMVDTSRSQLWVVDSGSPDTPPELIEIPLSLSVNATADVVVGESSVTARFTALATGGTWNYTAWSWTFGDGATSAAENPVHTYTHEGVYNASVTVIDTLGGAVTSANITIRVPALLPPIELALGATNSTPLLGESVGLFENATGGSVPYSYYWQGLPPGCVTENSSVLACLPTQAGSYEINGTVGDPSGAYASSTLTLVVSWGFEVEAPSSSTEGASLAIRVTFTSPAVGPLTYSYSGLPAGCSDRNASSLTCAPTQLGEFRVGVSVSDAGGDHSERTVTVDIVPAAGFLGLPGSTGYYLLVGLAAVAVLGTIVARAVTRRSPAVSRAPDGTGSTGADGTPSTADEPPTIEYLAEGEIDPAEDLF